MASIQPSSRFAMNGSASCSLLITLILSLMLGAGQVVVVGGGGWPADLSAVAALAQCEKMSRAGDGRLTAGVGH
jgi:hypothetical protein